MDFAEWVGNGISARPSDETRPTPLAQLKARLTAFCGGAAMAYGSEIHLLDPMSKCVWALKTADLRLFGWFAVRDCLILHEGRDATWLHDDVSRYDQPIASTAVFRDMLDPPLPGPVTGVRAADVISNRSRSL